MPFATVDEAAELYRRGEVVIIVDDEDRENEGDLCIAAGKVTPESINFMARFGRGLICLAMTEERCQELDLPLMVEHNTSNYGTALPASLETRGEVPTGTSARAQRPADQAGRSAPSRPRLSVAREKRRRSQACRADRGLGRSGHDRRNDA